MALSEEDLEEKRERDFSASFRTVLREPPRQVLAGE
jgi:hypothetical protein